MVELSEGDAGLRKLGALESPLRVHRSKPRNEGRVLHINMVRIRVVGYIIHLLRFLSHEAVRGRNVTEIKPRQIVSGQHVLFRVLKVCLEVFDEAIIVDALHVLIWVELVFELAVVIGVCFVYHVPVVFPGVRFADGLVLLIDDLLV